MPWSNNSGGPWGGGPSGGGGKNPWGAPPPGRGPGGGGNGGGGPQPPNLDELFRQSQERLKRTFGGGGGSGGGMSGKALFGIGALVALAIWIYASIFQVEQNEKAVVLTFGEYSSTKGPGLNFAFWPFQTHQTIATTTDRLLGIGDARTASQRRGGRDSGLMLTGDENVVDVEFEIAWDIADPKNYLFNLASPNETIEAVSEASIREVIGQSQIDPVLQRDQVITQRIKSLIQNTMDGYRSGVNIERVNFVSVSPPKPVIDSFDNVTKATQKNQQLKLDADGYRFQKLADARGEAAQIAEDAAGYALRVENGARGEAARFESIYEEYKKAPEVTRKRLYLETMERVFSDINKVILDENGGGASGVVPYLPLNELRTGGGNSQ